MKTKFLILCFAFSCFSFIDSKQEDLRYSERKIYSQNGEDGVIATIFKLIPSSSKYYVEFGVQDGSECNTRYLREKFGWCGLMMDADHFDEKINLQQEIITAENINDLFEKYGVPYEFGLLSIDIDYNDFYVWKALSPKYRPEVIIIEFNSTHLPHEDKVVVYNPNYFWDRSNYFGASILSIYKLARKKGYSLVYVDNRSVNLFFIRDDILNKTKYVFKNVNCVEKLYKYPHYGNGPNRGYSADLLQRTYVTADELLKDN